MTDQQPAKKKTIYFLLYLPFFLGVVLAIIGGVRTDGILLESVPNLYIRFQNISLIALSYLLIIAILLKLGITKLDLPKTRGKKVAFIAIQLLILYISSAMCTIGVWVNLNYSLRKKPIKRIELIVTNKYLPQVRRRGIQVSFHSEFGKLIWQTSRKQYDSTKIGERYSAYVNEGFFNGFYLTARMQKISD